MNNDRKLHLTLLVCLALILIWSAIRPHDYFTWALEVAPALLGVGVLALFYNRFRFTNLVYILVFSHCIILIVGGKYTYAEMPLFNWIRDTFGHARNNYDKVGHFAQGFFPAIVIREVLIRNKVVRRGGWLFFIVACVALAFSAFYEFIEWWVSLAVGSKGDSFLGTQGYVWDTQSDMFLAMSGAILSQLIFSKMHDTGLQKLEE
jgi:putative membrane protein